MRIAVLGGGQLGRMLGLAGIPLGMSFAFVDPSAEAPAAAVGDLVVGALDDVRVAEVAAKGADVVTYEWEGVPSATATALAAHLPVRPGAAALDVAQDRVREKTALRALGVHTAPFAAVDTRAELASAADTIGIPGVLKTRRGGYDGKGQYVLRTADDIELAWRELGRAERADLILEGYVAFTRELSIVAVRAIDGEVRCWPAVENEHRGGILRVTRAPAPHLDDALQARAEACIRPLLESLDYVGVACVELFDTGEALLANEIAPRVHNSGHWTIEGAECSQFENHVRAITGLPLGSTTARGVSAMVNIIGTFPERDAILAIEGSHLHDYGKLPRPGRKLGHVTITAPDVATRDERLARVVALCDGA